MTEKEYQKLILEINKLRDQIHIFDNEVMDEQLLDQLKHKITIFEEQNPQKISKNSPNYKVSGGVKSGFKKFFHRQKMLSLNDIFSFNEFLEWEKRWEKYLEKNYQDDFEKYKSKFETVFVQKLDEDSQDNQNFLI